MHPRVKIYDHNPYGINHLVAIVTTCPFCEGADSFLLPKQKVNAWRDGALIQDVFPDMSADRREQLISGAHGTCFESAFAYEEEYDWEPDYEEMVRDDDDLRPGFHNSNHYDIDSD